MKFTLEIELGNDAMQTGLDVAQALDEVCAGINTDGPWKVGESDTICDANGNVVGKWTVSDDLQLLCINYPCQLPQGHSGPCSSHRLGVSE